MLSPKLTIYFFRRIINSFLFFGVLGFIAGLALGISLSRWLSLEISIILLLSIVGAITFFLLAFAAKIITGKESIVYYHHEIAIMLMCTLGLYLLKIAILPYLDIALLGIGIFLAFGRIGCFNVGCCHGRPGTFGYHYGEHHVADGFTWYYRDVTLLPVQLIESGFVFSIVITGTVLLLNHAAPGTVLILYTVVYGAFRFIIEFFRGDAERPYWKGLSEAQWTTLLLVAITLTLSFTGYLPFYQWHMIIFLLLATCALYVMLAMKKNSEYRLLHARHIREMAIGLQHMGLQEKNLPHAENAPVNIYVTSEGLSISSEYYHAKNERIQHYTISGNSTLKLNRESVHRIGKLIGLLQKHTSKFEIVEKENGIYHLIFYQESYQEKSLFEKIN